MLLKQLLKDETNNKNMNTSGVFRPKNILDNDEIMGKITRINSPRKQSIVNSKNLRYVAARIFDKKNGLKGIELADIPIMSVELQTIVQTFKEFSKMIEFLSAGYDH